IFAQVGDFIKTVLVPIFEKMWPVIKKIISVLFGFIVKTIKNALKVISGILDVLKGVFTGDFGLIKKGVLKIFGALWDQVKNVLKSAWKMIKTVLGPLVGWFKKKFTDVKDKVVKVVGGMKEALSKSWNGIKDAFAKPVNWVIENVINKLIDKINGLAKKLGIDIKIDKVPKLPLSTDKPAKNNKNANAGGSSGGMRFAAKNGGVLPGWTPGRDVHHFQSPTGGQLHLSGGEAIMRPEFTRAVGGAAGVARLNMLARRGRVAFAKGGVFQPVPGHMNSHGSGYYGATTA